MVKFLKPNTAVIVLQGRFVGRKVVIVRNFDEGTRNRPYGHCLIAGVAKYPRNIICKDSAKKTAKKSRVKAFLKVVTASKETKARFEERFKTGKNWWILPIVILGFYPPICPSSF